MKTIASLLLVIGLCVLSNGMPNAIKEVAERDIAKDVSNLVSSLGQAPVTGPPKTELIQAGKNDDLPIGAKILEELHTVDDKKNVPVTGPPKTVKESEDNDMSSDALIQEDEVDAMRGEDEDKTCTCTCKSNSNYGRYKDDDDEPACTCTCNHNNRRKSRTYRDCQDAYSRGRRDSGVYTIRPSKHAFKAYCDMSTDNGGWTVFQRRKDGSVDFYRNWDQYVNGFGNLNGEFWLGLRQINEITAFSSSSLRVDLPSSYYAKYSSFSVGDSASKYTLSVSGYSGNAGYDSLSYHNGMKFTTLDQDNDNWGSNCASQNSKGGFWYNACHYVNPNGEYNSYMYWYPLGNIKFEEMKIRRN
eukprot:Em0051g4a